MKSPVAVMVTATACTILIFAVIVLAGCSSGPSVPACRAALLSDYRYALAHPHAPAPAAPAACHGLSQAQLRKIAGQILDQVMQGR